MPNVVGIQFKEVGKTYYFAPNDINFSVGDGAIVETSRGVEYGKVVISNREVDEKEIVGQLKSVIRKATEDDVKTVKKHHEAKIYSYGMECRQWYCRRPL